MTRWLIRLAALAAHIAVAMVWSPNAALALFSVGGFLAILAPDLSADGGERDGQPPMDM